MVRRDGCCLMRVQRFRVHLLDRVEEIPIEEVSAAAFDALTISQDWVEGFTL